MVIVRRLVTWKDEGQAGPVMVYEPDARPSLNRFGYPMTSRPYGAPLLGGVTSRGWMTRARAKRLARELNADFHES